MPPTAYSDSDRPGLVIADLRSKLAGPFDLQSAGDKAIVITGRSGSGKSLFLRMVADLDVNLGTVTLDGRDRLTYSAPVWRRLVTYVAAESGWWFDTIAEHFSTPQLDRAAALSEELGLSRDQLYAPVSQLSSGERQRWGLVRAVVQNPRVLLLDEPTGALDQRSVERVERFLHQLFEQGTMLVLVTHDPGLAERMGGQRFEMRDRRLWAA